MDIQRLYYVKEGLVSGRPFYHVAYQDAQTVGSNGLALSAHVITLPVEYPSLTEAVMAASKLNLGLVTEPPQPSPVPLTGHETPDAVSVARPRWS